MTEQELLRLYYLHVIDETYSLKLGSSFLGMSKVADTIIRQYQIANYAKLTCGPGNITINTLFLECCHDAATNLPGNWCISANEKFDL